MQLQSELESESQSKLELWVGDTTFVAIRGDGGRHAYERLGAKGRGSPDGPNWKRVSHRRRRKAGGRRQQES